MRSIILSIAALSACAVPAFAETLSQPGAVVELFTSQGCPSSPAANNFITELDRTHPDILTLSYGVSYWDYLGWKDTFGKAASSDRQRQYDKALESGLYTPMLVVGGKSHGGELKPESVITQTVPANLWLARRSGELCIEGQLPSGSKLALISYEPNAQTVSVEAGQNRGQILNVTNVVTGMDYKDWNGGMMCGFYPKAALAVLAHDAETSAIIGAARYEP